MSDNPTRKERIYAERIRANALALEEIARDAEALGDTSCADGCVYLYVENVDAALRHFDSLGYKVRGSQEKNTGDGFGSISWRLVRPGDDKPRLRLAKMILAGGKDACRLVQVGTRTREEPVYEIQCPEPKAVLQGYSDAIRAAEGEGGAP